MTNANILSRFIDDILLKVISLGNGYGYSISKTITLMTEGNWQIKEATLYSGLRRLENEELIASYWGDETQGGRRKYYVLTQAGQTSLQENIQNWESAKSIMDNIFSWRDLNE